MSAARPDDTAGGHAERIREAIALLDQNAQCTVQAAVPRGAR